MTASPAPSNIPKPTDVHSITTKPFPNQVQITNFFSHTQSLSIYLRSLGLVHSCHLTSFTFCEFYSILLCKATTPHPFIYLTHTQEPTTNKELQRLSLRLSNDRPFTNITDCSLRNLALEICHHFSVKLLFWNHIPVLSLS